MKIAILTGGIGKERPISISSAQNIKEYINFANSDIFIFPEQEVEFFSNLQDYDIVIPIIHGIGGEDGILQKKLDERGIKYLFSGPRGHALSFDKKICKEELIKHGILSPRTFKLENIKNTDFPFISKSLDGGSSFGVEIISSFEQLEKKSKNSLFEEYIVGREFTVGVIENIDGKNKSLPVVEILKEGLIFDESQKYSDNTHLIEICPAKIGSNLENKLKSLALMVHKKLGLKHISRSDFIVTDKNEIYFLEVNTIPGVTKKSLIIKELSVGNYDFSQLLEYWYEISL